MSKAFFTFLAAIALTVIATSAFVPPNPSMSIRNERSLANSATKLYLFGEEGERKSLTRDSEPEDFFATNTDKMSDQEKIPIALAGMLGISLPFILGLIALYASK